MNAPSLWPWYVRALRSSTGESQGRFAARFGMKQGPYSRWESGDYVPSEAARVAHFARSLGRNPLEAFVAAGMLTIEEAGAGLDDVSRQTLRFVAEQAKVSSGVPLNLVPADALGAEVPDSIFAVSDNPEAYHHRRLVGSRKVGFRVIDAEQARDSDEPTEAELDGDIDFEDELDLPQARPLRRGMPGGAAPLAEAARRVNEEPGLTKRRREHDEAAERIEDDPTGMEPI